MKNYRVNGEAIYESPELLPNGPTDTPFQLLKLHAYWNFLNEKHEKDDLIDELLGKDERNLAMVWIQCLGDENKRDSFAWPHGHRSGIDYFRLDDHVWI